MNRSLSVRSQKKEHGSTSAGPTGTRHRFNMASLRGMQQPELSKKLFRLIKSENHVISAYETASRERISVASQLSDWGEATNDDAISDISDKLGVLLSEIGEQENAFGENLEESRGVLKQIRNTESSVQPSRDHKAKISDEIQKLKYKDPQNVKLPQLEQELVRAEAENLVAEAQLTNVTRQQLKTAYDHHFAAVIERAEKQVLLARHGRRLLNLLDDQPVVPGDTRAAFDRAPEARQIIADAEEDLREWRPQLEPVQSSAGGGALEANTLMPASTNTTTTATGGNHGGNGSGGESVAVGPAGTGGQQQQQGTAPYATTYRDETETETATTVHDDSDTTGQTYPPSEAESRSAVA